VSWLQEEDFLLKRSAISECDRDGSMMPVVCIVVVVMLVHYKVK